MKTKRPGFITLPHDEKYLIPEVVLLISKPNKIS